jgi:glycerol-3-phosphate dehydrogenase
MLVEEDHGIEQIILPVPNRVSKGILVTPTVFGGLMLGPTAEDGDNKGDLATTGAGLQAIRDEPELPEYQIEKQSDEGDVVCLCCSITRGEILAALRSPLPPASLDSLKRRTGAMLGQCQGNLCLPRIFTFFQQELERDPLALPKHLAQSSPLAARLAHLTQQE